MPVPFFPGTDSPKVGRFNAGQILDAIETQTDGDGNEWVAVKTWVAAKYKGRQFVKPV